MKMHRTLLAGVITTVAVTLPSASQPAATAGFHYLDEADKIVGKVITDAHNQRVGRVTEMSVDWSAGRIAEVFVDTGGFLTSGQRIVAVPPECLTPVDEGKGLFLNAAIDPFESAPEIDLGRWNGGGDNSSVLDLYKRFQVPIYGNPGRLEKVGKITGMAIYNRANERLGKVGALVVDLPSGIIPDIIVRSGNELTAVPPQAFWFGPDRDRLILPTTKEALKSAPHFKPDQWRNAINGAMALSALDDNATQTDAVITSEIERKIAATDSLSMDARHVKVTTRKSWVTLNGIAESEREKREVGDIAATVVPRDHVHNRIEVRVFAMVQ